MTGWEPKVEIETGVQDLLKNIELFSNMPAWTDKQIADHTATWFKYLK